MCDPFQYDFAHNPLRPLNSVLFRCPNSALPSRSPSGSGLCGQSASSRSNRRGIFLPFATPVSAARERQKK